MPYSSEPTPTEDKHFEAALDYAALESRQQALSEVLEFFDSKIKEQQDYIRHHEHKNAHMDMSSAEAILEDRTDLKEEYQDWLTKQIDAT